jgi:transcription termination factor Rho
MAPEKIFNLPGILMDLVSPYSTGSDCVAKAGKTMICQNICHQLRRIIQSQAIRVVGLIYAPEEVTDMQRMVNGEATGPKPHYNPPIW